MTETINDISRLVLGTAQFGMDYGIANSTGMPAYTTARSIVEKAWEHGIREFDTAQVYGTSENVLGKCLKEIRVTNEAKIITKLAPDIDYSDNSVVDKAFILSMENLGVESLFGVMLHRADTLDVWENGVGHNLKDLIDSGRLQHIGVSVYSPEKAIQALNTKGISMVQLPTNILDRRFERAGVFELADKMGKQIYIRSVFLQGLLLLTSDSLPKHMQFATSVLHTLENFSRDVNLCINKICLGYIKHAFPSAKLVFGAENLSQIQENIENWNTQWPLDLNQKIQAEFNDINEKLLNPSLWPQKPVPIILKHRG